MPGYPRPQRGKGGVHSEACTSYELRVYTHNGGLRAAKTLPMRGIVASPVTVLQDRGPTRDIGRKGSIVETRTRIVDLHVLGRTPEARGIGQSRRAKRTHKNRSTCMSLSACGAYTYLWE